MKTKLQQSKALRKLALAELECKVWEKAESNKFRYTSFSNPNLSTLLTPNSVETQFTTSSTPTKKVTFGETAI